MKYFITSRAAQCTGALAIAVLATLATAPAATAHAQVQSSTPSAGQVLPSSPRLITIAFNEPVIADPEGTRLLDSSGNPYPAELGLAESPAALSASPEQGTQVTLTPRGALPSGNWAVTWRTVSADGHIVSGIIPFSIGGETSAAGDGQPGQDQGVPPPVLSLLEAFTWAGGIAAGMLLAGGSRRPIAALAIVGAVAGTARLAALDAQAGSLQLLLASGEGKAALLATAAGIATAASCGQRGRTRIGAAVLALALFASQAFLSGHHLLTGNGLLTAIHAVHLIAAAAWAGAVVALLSQPDPAQAERTRRQATIAVIALLPAGSSLAVGMLIAASPGTMATPWGLLLLAKVALVAAAAGLGILHHQRLKPGSLTASDPRRLRRWTVAEGAVICVVVAATSLLSASSGYATKHPGPSDTTTTNSNPSARPRDTDTSMARSEPLPSQARADIALDDGTHAHVTWANGTWKVTQDGKAPREGELKVVHQSSGAAMSVSLGLADGQLQGTGPLPLSGSWNVDVQLADGPFSQVKGKGTLSTRTTSPDTAPAPALPSGRNGT